MVRGNVSLEAYALPPSDTFIFGRALRRWRALHRVKQAHAAEMFGVTQSTISRWESGASEIEPEHRHRLATLLGARLESGADTALVHLIGESPRPMHLICDLSHRLLALSPPRAAEFGVDASALVGQSLWRYATPELQAAEASLIDVGWHGRAAPPPLEIATGLNRSNAVPIRPSRCRWTRFILSDGSAARLVETIA